MDQLGKNKKKKKNQNQQNNQNEGYRNYQSQYNRQLKSNSYYYHQNNNQDIQQINQQDYDCCFECKQCLTECWDTICKELCCCCCILFCPHLFMDQQFEINIRHNRNFSYMIFVFFDGLYDQFTTVSLQVENLYYNQLDINNNETQFDQFPLRKITNNLAYVKFRYWRISRYKIEVSKFIGASSISEIFIHDQDNTYPVFLLPEGFQPSNCMNIIPCLRAVTNTPHHEIENHAALVEDMIKISNKTIINIWGIKSSYRELMEVVKNYLERRQILHLFPGETKIKFVQILIDNDQKEDDNIKYLKMIGSEQIKNPLRPVLIDEKYVGTILSYFYNCQTDYWQNEEEAIVGLAVVFNSCKSENVLLSLKFREKLSRFWPQFQFDLIKISKENKFDYYQVGKFLGKNNLFQYLTRQERIEIESESLRYKNQTLPTILEFCDSFQFQIDEQFWYTHVNDKLKLISDWKYIFLFWYNNSKLILGIEIPQMIINCFEKFCDAEFQSKYQQLKNNEIIIYHISVLDALYVAYDVVPSTQRNLIYDSHMKKIQSIIGQRLQEIQENQLPNKISPPINQAPNDQKQDENLLAQALGKQPQVVPMDIISLLEEYISLLNTLSQHNFCQLSDINSIIDNIFNMIYYIIQQQDILGNANFTPYDVIFLKKKISSKTQQQRFREIFESKINLEMVSKQITDDFINNVMRQCLKKDFSLTKESFAEYYEIVLNILADRMQNDIGIIFNNQIFHDVILSCKMNEKFFSEHPFYKSVKIRIQQFYRDLTTERIDIHLAEQQLCDDRWKNVEKIFNILQFKVKKNELRILSLNVSQIIKWKIQVQTWLNFHKNSKDMPIQLKRLTANDTYIQINEVGDIVSQVQKYELSFLMFNYLKDCVIFNSVINKYKNKLQNSNFRDMEFQLKNLIFLRFHSICRSIFKYENAHFSFSFRLSSKHPLLNIVKTFEQDVKHLNAKMISDQHYSVVDYRMLNEHFKVELFRNINELQADLDRIVYFYEDFLQNEKIIINQNFSANIFIYMDIDSAREKARCVKKISKLFGLVKDQTVSQYTEFLTRWQKISDDTPLQTVISSSQLVHQTLQQISQGLDVEDFYYLMAFTSAKKTIKFIMENKNIDFEEIFGWNEEADKNLEQSILLMNGYSKQVKQQYQALDKIKGEGFLKLCKGISKETRDIMEKNPTFYHELSQINQYITQIKDLVDGPQVKSEKVQTIIQKLLEKGVYYIEVKQGSTNLYTMQDNEKLYSKDMTSIYTRGFLVTMGTANQALQEEKDMQLVKVKAFQEQVEILQELKVIVDQLRSLGNFSFQELKIEFNNRKGLELCMSDIKTSKLQYEQEMRSWIQCLELSYKEYPILTLIPQRLLSVVVKVMQKKDLPPSDQQEINNLFQTIAKGLDYRQFSIDNINDQQNDNQQQLKQLGIFLSDNLQTFIQLRKTNSQEPKIYVQRLLYGSENQLYMILQQSFTSETRSFQYFFCDQLTTYHDIMLFVNRFLNLHILSCFYIVDFQNCNAQLREQIAEKLYQITKNKSDPSNNKLVILSLVNSNTDRVELQQYDAVLPQNKGLMPQIIKQKVHTYFSEYGGLGKSFQIMNDIGQKQHVTIPIHNTYSKIEKINLILKKLQQGQIEQNELIKAIHLEITDSNDIHQLNLLLFEILVLRFVNSNYSVFTSIDSNIDVYIEVQNTLNNSLAHNLRMLDIFEEHRKNLIFDLNKVYVKQNPTSKIQVVLRYLKALDQGTNIASKRNCDFGQTYLLEPQKLPVISQKEAVTILQKFFLSHYSDPTKNINSPNYYTLMHFIRFLAKQYRGLDQQPIFNINDPDMPQVFFGSMDHAVELRYQLLKLLYDLGFVQAYEASGDLFNIQGKEMEKMKSKNVQQQQEMVARRVKPYKDLQQDFVAFSSDGIPICCYLKTQMPQTLQMAYDKIKEQIKNDDYEQPDLFSRDQFKLVKHLVKLCNDKPQLIIKNWQATNFLEADMTEKLRTEMQSIAISSDNFFKMALIFLRISAKTPTITMGETGIGKTAVIKLLSYIMDMEFLTLDVHAGIDKNTIIETVEKAERISATSNNNKVVLFFDEINTNNNICGLLKEILIDRRLEGRKINKNILLLAACNPYKLKKNASSTFTAGIKQNKLDEQNQLLVYRVEPMPQSMFYFIQNYDILEDSDLQFYIRKIIEREEVFQSNEIDHLLVHQVFSSQKFVNNVDAPQSCSLRDVVRFAKLTSWFQKVYFVRKENAVGRKGNLVQNKLKSILLALDFCYHNRLQTEQLRANYRSEMISIFNSNKMNHGLQEIMFQAKGDMLFAALEEEANFLLDCVNPPQDFGRNQALKENIFAMFVCIFNKIPLFLTGPPGCSKTSSFNLIYKSLFKGSGNRNAFLKQFPNIRLRSYQGHLQSTSQNVERVFIDAINLQNDCTHNNLDTIVVVFIDELGLAELSPHNPLKILHSILENPQVAVIGISNWTLDASKQNRALSLSRDYASKSDLIVTAESIVQTMNVSIPKEYIEKIVTIFLNLLDQTNKIINNFFGNRDFYNMIKYICSEWNNTESSINVIVKGFFRNFSGHSQMDQLLFKVIFSQFGGQALEKPTITSLIRDNLVERKELYPTRHLMIFTDDEEGAISYVESQFLKKCKVFFGSDFSEDKIESSTNSIINEIVVCIETGIPCIVINFESIYQSFYAMLNQNYIEIRGGEVKVCQIAYGYDKRNIQVNPEFKFVLIAKLEDRKRLDPPLLNRFEKHEYTRQNLLQEEDLNLLKKLKEWTTIFNEYDEEDNLQEQKDFQAFCCEDIDGTLSSIISYNKDSFGIQATEEQIFLKCVDDMLWITHFGGVIRSQNQMIIKQYINHQKHQNLVIFVDWAHKQCVALNQNYVFSDNNFNDWVTPLGFNSVIYTFQTITNELIQDQNIIKLSCIHRTLETFHSEKELDQYLEVFFTSKDVTQLLILSAEIYSNDSHERIMLTRNRISQNRKKQKDGVRNVCLIIKMRKQSCELLRFNTQWKQVSLDNLYDCFMDPSKVLENKTEIEKIYKLLSLESLIEKYLDQILCDQILIQYYLFQENTLGTALSMIDYSTQDEPERVNAHIQDVIKVFRDKQNKDFINIIVQRMCQFIQKNPFITDENQNKSWLMLVFVTGEIQNCMSLHKALINFLNKIIINSLSQVLYEFEYNNCIECYVKSPEMRELFFQQLDYHILSKPAQIIQNLKLKSLPLPLMFPFFFEIHQKIIKLEKEWRSNKKEGDLQSMSELILEFREIQICKNPIYLTILTNDICSFINVKYFHILKVLVPYFYAIKNAFEVYEVLWKYEDVLIYQSQFINNMLNYIPIYYLNQELDKKVESSNDNSVAGIFNKILGQKSKDQDDTQLQQIILQKINFFYYNKLLPIEENLRGMQQTLMSYDYFANIYLRFIEAQNPVPLKYKRPLDIIKNFYQIICRPLNIDLKILFANKELFNNFNNFLEQNSDKILDQIMKLDLKNKNIEPFMKEFLYTYVAESIKMSENKASAIKRICEQFNKDKDTILSQPAEQQTDLIHFNCIIYRFFDKIDAKDIMQSIKNDSSPDKLLNLLSSILETLKIQLEHEISIVIVHNIELILKKKYKYLQIFQDFFDFNYLDILFGKQEVKLVPQLITLAVFRILAQPISHYIVDVTLDTQQINLESFLFQNAAKDFNLAAQIRKFCQNFFQYINNQTPALQKIFKGFLSYLMKSIYFFKNGKVNEQIERIQQIPPDKVPANLQQLIWIKNNFDPEIKLEYQVSKNPWRAMDNVEFLLQNTFQQSIYQQDFSYLRTISQDVLFYFILTVFHTSQVSGQEIYEKSRQKIKEILNNQIQNQSNICKLMLIYLNQFNDQQQFRQYLVLSSNQNQDQIQIFVSYFSSLCLFDNYFSSLMQDPDKFLDETTYVPFMIKNEELFVIDSLISAQKGVSGKKDDRFSRYQCSCGYRFVIANCGETVEDGHGGDWGINRGKCPQCKNNIGNQEGGKYGQKAQGIKRIDVEPIMAQQKAKNEIDQQKGYIHIDPAELDQSFRERKLNSLAFRIGHLFLHCSMIINCLVMGAELTSLRKVLKLQTTFDKLVELIWNHIIYDWKCLSKTLNVNDDQILFLLSDCLQRLIYSKQNLLSKQFNFTQNSDREKFEEIFQQLIVNPVQKNQNKIIQGYFGLDNKQNKVNEVNLLSIQVREAFTSQTLTKPEIIKTFLPNQLRYTVEVSEQVIQNQISLLNMYNQVPFLHYLFTKKKELEYLYQYGNIFVSFYQKIHKAFSRELTKMETEKSLVSQLKLRGLDDITEDYIKNFVPAWNEISKSGQEFQITVCRGIQLPLIESPNDATINLFLMRKSIEDTNYFFKLLENIQYRQNSILNDIYQISSNQQSHSDWILNLLGSDSEKQIKSLPLHKLNKNHILKQWKMEHPEIFCMPCIYYGQGHNLYSDLVRLEKEILSEVLREKIFIDFDRSAIFEYKADISSGFLVDLVDFTDRVEQENPPGDIFDQFLRKMDNYEETYSFLQDLVNCVKLLKNIGGNKDILIYKVALDFSLINKNDKRKEQLLKNFRLKHINSLIDGLEAAVMDSLVTMCLQFYKQQLLDEEKKKLQILMQDIDIEACVLAIGRYIIRACSNDSFGDSSSSNLFDELFANDDIIPGIELLWPPQHRENLKDLEWYQISQKVCQIKKSKILQTYQYLKQNQQIWIQNKQQKLMVDESNKQVDDEMDVQLNLLKKKSTIKEQYTQLISDNNDLTIKQIQKANVLKVKENEGGNEMNDSEDQLIYILPSLSQIKNKSVSQKSEHIEFSKILLERPELEPEVVKQKYKVQKEQIKQLDVKGDTDISLENVDFEFVENKDMNIQRVENQQEKNLLEAPSENVARPIKILPEIPNEVQKTLQKFGEYVPQQLEAQFNLCVELPPYEFVNQQSSDTFSLKQEIIGVYVGQWKKGKRWGVGKFFFGNGAMYHGTWVNDKQCHSGRMIYPDGDMYEGEWKSNMCHGQGVYIYANGLKYEGQFYEDEKHGNGVEFMIDSNNVKSTYTGQYYKGLKHGEASVLWANGTSYAGEFVSNRIEGKGIYTWPDKRVYSGQFKNFKMNGFGIYKWPDGRIYEGNYVDDKKEGYGVFTWPDGKTYKGEWLDGKQNGKGIMTEKNGIERQAEFKNGKFVCFIDESVEKQ